MFEVLPTRCLQWLMRVISKLENQQEVTHLEEGLWDCANGLLPQLQSLYNGSWGRHPQAANLLGEYCEICLELCDELLQLDSPVDEQLADQWRHQVEQAAEAFREAEQSLTEGCTQASLVA